MTYQNDSSTWYAIWHIGDGAKSGGSTLHYSSSLDGPWMPYSPSPPGCNNPAPMQAKNGTWFVVCGHTSVLRSESLFGPWTHVSSLSTNGITGGDIRYEGGWGA